MDKPVILCVDDEQMILTSLKSELREAFRDDYIIETAEGGEDALEVFDELQEDEYEIPLIISDYLMPDIKGDELLKRIHEISPQTLKIMLTGQADTQAVGNAVNDAKLYRYIAKPWDQKDLALTVTEAVRSYFQGKQIEAQNEELRQVNHSLEQKVREQEETLRLFMRYVPQPVVEQALSASEESIFDGELKDIAVLFCDIRGFTPLAEALSPKEVVSFLNDYYAMMTEIVKRHDGAVNQFVGDEVFATFGAPVMTDNNEKNAVFCAIEMMSALKTLNQKYAEKFNTEIKIGIGINAGEVVAGNLGSEDKIEYCVSGDTVNTGKRIESITKDHPNSILISDSVYQQVKELVETKMFEPLAVKGKKDTVLVYEILAPK